MMRTFRTLLAALCAWGALVAPAPAQSVSYLLPDRFEIAAGSEVALHVARERAGALQRVAWPSRELEWLFARTAGTQRNFGELPVEHAGSDSVRLTFTEPDVALIGMDCRPRVEQVSAAELRKFLELEIDPDALPGDWRAHASGEVVSVRRVESAKLLVRVARRLPEGKLEAWNGSATAASKSGQRTEIRPLVDPTAMVLGSDLPLRVTWADSSNSVARIVARHVDSGQMHSSRAPDGAGWFTVDASGAWRVEVHRARLLRDDPSASWELETATLSFVVPDRGKKEGGGK